MNRSMQKYVIIINGIGGVGKDTLCDFAAKHYPVRNISSITPIKELAKRGGWQGEKDARARKLLSDLKKIFTAYNDLPMKYMMEEYAAFLRSGEQLLFVHIREPLEIERLRLRIQSFDSRISQREGNANGGNAGSGNAGNGKANNENIRGGNANRENANDEDTNGGKAYDGNPPCLTLLIKRQQGRESWGNASDDQVESYPYNHIYHNDKTLAEAEMDFVDFISKITGIPAGNGD